MLASEETIEDHTAKFRDYLLFGHQKEGLLTVFLFTRNSCSQLIVYIFIAGLEYAMAHGLWGHALFLASKMDDERSYSQGLSPFSFVLT